MLPVEDTRKCFKLHTAPMVCRLPKLFKIEDDKETVTPLQPVLDLSADDSIPTPFRWHCTKTYVLGPTGHCVRVRILVLLSPSADGQLMARGQAFP